MRLEILIAGVFIAGTGVGFLPTVLGAEDPEPRTATTRGTHICWKRSDDGKVWAWAEYLPGTTCPFLAPEEDPDQQTATVEEQTR